MRVGIDLGGTKTEAIAMDAGGEVLARVRLPTERGARGVVRTIGEALGAVLAEAGAAEASSLGIGLPGLIDPERGTVESAMNLDLHRLDLVRAVREGVPGLAVGAALCIENDVNATALGAWRLLSDDGVRGGAAAGARGGVRGETLAYLNLGTGVAAGIVRGGEIVRGDHGVAGEVGHIRVDPAGPVCVCGQRGCIESYAGGGAIALQWGRDDAYPVLAVFDAADADDPRAIALRDGLIDGVVMALQVLALAIDPDTLVLGGGVAMLGDRLADPVRDGLRRLAASSPFLASLTIAERLRLAPTDVPVAALGAGMLAVPASPAADLVPRPEIPHG